MGVLDHRDPLLRSAAVQVLEALPPASRWPLLQPRLSDTSKLVRLALATATRDIPDALVGNHLGVVRALQQEYQAMLEGSADMPSAQLGLADLALQKGDLLSAQQHFEIALAIDPTDIPSLMNYADFNRRLGDEARAGELLQKAVDIAPDSALVNVALGLSEVRRKNYPAAIEYLRAAVATDNAIPHHHYVLAVALQNQGDVKAAVEVLSAAIERWPYDYTLLSTAINFQSSQGGSPSLVQWVANLSEVAPNAPEVRAYLKTHRQ